MQKLRLLLIAVGASVLIPALSAAEYLVYFGGYSRGGGKGIYFTKFDTATGKAGELALAAEVPNPSFLAIHPNRQLLYAVSEMGGGGKEGTVSAFSIDKATGKLTLLNHTSSKGGGPCHLNVDKNGKCVVVANYGTGSVAALPLNAKGELGAATSFIQHAGSSTDPKRQQGPHAHSVNYSAQNTFVVAADLGLDEVFVYKFAANKCSLTANDPPFTKIADGSGPRHFTFHPAGKFAYSINELKSTVTAFNWNGAKGTLKEIQTISTLPKDFTGTSYTAEVVAHPSGKFLYGSNRGHDSIALFTIDTEKGTLTPVEQVSTQGKTPRNFVVDPTGAWLLAANQDGNNIVVFKIDQQTGRLTPTGQQLQMPAPVCIRFVALN